MGATDHDHPKSGVLVVLTDVDPAADEEFNEWYDDEHVPERVALAGVRRARWFRRVDDVAQPAPGTLSVRRGPQYLVIYELDDVALLEGEWSEVMAIHSERSRRMYRAMANTIRGAYELVGDFGAGDER